MIYKYVKDNNVPNFSLRETVKHKNQKTNSHRISVHSYVNKTNMCDLN